MKINPRRGFLAHVAVGFEPMAGVGVVAGEFWGSIHHLALTPLPDQRVKSKPFYNFRNLPMETYDIYLTKSYRTGTDLSNLSITGITFTPHLTTLLQKKEPRFLELDLSLVVAQAFLKELKRNGALGLLLPIKYRQLPTITLEQAKMIATTAIQSQQAQTPHLHFGPISLGEEQPMSWEFVSEVIEWTQQGSIPSTLVAIIDKVDGHVWSEDEEWDFGEFQP